MEPFITTEVIFDALEQNAELLWNNIEPVIMPLIVTGLFWNAIKFILHKLYSFVNIGLTAREERRAYKKIDNIVDGVSNISDLASSLKSDKGK